MNTSFYLSTCTFSSSPGGKSQYCSVEVERNLFNFSLSLFLMVQTWLIFASLFNFVVIS